MLEFILMGMIAFGPMFFVGGIVAGKKHVVYLAHNGGEEKYPKKIREAVQTYRDNNKYIIEYWEE